MSLEKTQRPVPTLQALEQLKKEKVRTKTGDSRLKPKNQGTEVTSSLAGTALILRGGASKTERSKAEPWNEVLQER